MFSRIILLLLCLCTLAACAPFRPNDQKAGLCNQLNSKMIFSGSTSDTRQSEIQQAEEPLVQSDYDKHCDR
ncbi:MAG: hypothetical protein ACD_46C00650G0003 [uncultured bacterium]|nr:MAG: hypothetical protein ACD_46C00650G0003 [uncultured bacterium]